VSQTAVANIHFASARPHA